MNADALLVTARQAMSHWGVNAPVLDLISHRENAVFRTTLKDGTTAALRLHRPGYNAQQDILSELWVSNELAKTGFPCPKPLATDSDDLLVCLADGQCATMISWVDGAPIGSGEAGIDQATGDKIALYHDVGALLAELHTATDQMQLGADFSRRRWDAEGFLGKAPHWGRFWENPILTREDSQLLQAARTKARADLAQFQSAGADYGFIHADALRENIFYDGNGLTLIDFDDSGFGFRLYDLATALSQSVDDADYMRLRQAIVDGYRTRRALDDHAALLLPLFQMLRTMASLGWAIPRLSPDDPGVSMYAHRALRLSREYLG